MPQAQIPLPIARTLCLSLIRSLSPEPLSVLPVNEFAALEERVLRAVGSVCGMSARRRGCGRASERQCWKSQLLVLQAEVATAEQLHTRK